MHSESISIGQWIRKYRHQNGLTQREVADQAACAVITLQKFEADDRVPSIQLAQRIASVLAHHSEHTVFIELVTQARKRQRLATAVPSPVSHEPPSIFDYRGSSFVARESEIQTIKHAVLSKQYAMITLVGPPGVGKTRLAHQVLSELQTLYKPPIYSVPLAHVRTPHEVAATILEYVFAQEDVSDDPWTLLEEYVFEPRTLIFLDNVEQIDHAAKTILRLSQLAPQCCFLITSQHTLNLYGEFKLQVDPLSLPDPALHALADVERAPAVQLFVERVKMYTTFELTAANLDSVCAVCQILDGIPLALELAAYHFHLFTPEQFVAQLQQHQLTLLTSQARGVEARHATMLNTLGWAYSLLQPEQQCLLQAIALFPEPLTSQAVQAICFPERPFLEAIQSLQTLLQTHMVVRNEKMSDVEYGLLNVVRVFLKAHVSPLIDPAELERRYISYYESYLKQAIKTNDTLRLEQSYSALTHMLELLDQYQDINRFVSSVLSLLDFWSGSRRRYDGYVWLKQLLKYESVLSDSQKAQVYIALAHVAFDVQHVDTALACIQAFLALPNPEQDIYVFAQAWRVMGLVSQYHGDYLQAEHYFKRCLVCLKHAPDSEVYIYALGNLAQVAALRHMYDLALALSNECLLLTRYGPTQLECYLTIGTCYYRKPYHDYAEAKLSFDKALHLVQHLDSSPKLSEYQALIAFHCAYIAYLEHDVALAQQHLYRSTSYQLYVFDPVLTYQTLMLWSAVWMAAQIPVAQQMCTSLANVLVRQGVPITNVFVPECDVKVLAGQASADTQIAGFQRSVVSLQEQLEEIVQQTLELADSYAGSLVTVIQLPSPVSRR